MSCTTLMLLALYLFYYHLITLYVLYLLLCLKYTDRSTRSKKIEDDQYKTFCFQMNHFYEKYQNKKIEENNMVKSLYFLSFFLQTFFPFSQAQHYHLIYINMKEDSYEVIDNLRVGRTVTYIYARNVRLMVNFSKL